MITTKNTEIESIKGSHSSYRVNNDIFGLTIRDKTIQYLPTNLGEKFKNLIAIRINTGRLKEVHQSDLKSFINLRHLNFDFNDIEILEDGLFDFNPRLEDIWFEANKIKSIGEKIFDHLNALKFIDLKDNVCTSKRLTSRYEVTSSLPTIKQNCLTPEAKTTTSTTTTMETPREDVPKGSKNFLSFGILWIILGIAAIGLLVATNVLLFLRFYHKKTVVIKPIEPEDF